MTLEISQLTLKLRRLLGNNNYEHLLNEEFPWNSCNLDASPVAGPSSYITVDMVLKAAAKMKHGKAVGHSGVVAEMLKAAGHVGAKLIADS